MEHHAASWIRRHGGKIYDMAVNAAVLRVWRGKLSRMFACVVRSRRATRAGLRTCVGVAAHGFAKLARDGWILGKCESAEHEEE